MSCQHSTAQEEWEKKISVSVLLALLLSHGTMAAKDQNRHLNLDRIASYSPQFSCGISSPGAARMWVWRYLASISLGRWTGRIVGISGDFVPPGHKRRVLNF